MLTRVDRAASDPHAGFTLVEVIVAMILLSIVLVVAASVIVNGFAGSSKSLNERRAIQQVDRTMTSLDSALRSAKSSDRDEAIVPDAGSLSSALLAGAPLSGRRTAGGPQVTLDVNDILYADGTRIIVRSDVLPRPGVECVEYEVRVTGTNRSLIRNVWYAAAAGGPPVTCRIPPAVAPAPNQTETLISLMGDNA